MKHKVLKALVISAFLAAAAAGLIFMRTGPGGYSTRNIYLEMQENGMSQESTSGLELVFSNLDDVVAAFRKGLKEHSPSITISFVSKGEYREDISRLVRLMADQALIPTGMPDEGDYIRYQYGGYTLSYRHEVYNNGSSASVDQDDIRYKYTLTVEPEYYMDPEEHEKAEEAVRKALGELDIRWYMTEEERIIKVHDYIMEHVDYDRIHKNHPYYRYNATAYGALVYGHASCQGFCTAMYRLLMESGIDCRIVTGYAGQDGESEYHSWIIARVSGRYLNIDPAWDRQLGTDEYLLKDRDGFADHIRSSEFMTEEFLKLYPD